MYNKQRARQQRYQRREQKRRTQFTQRRALLVLLAVIAGLMALEIGLASPQPAQADPTQSLSSAEPTCTPAWKWPVRPASGEPTLLRPFENPPKPWLPGHRGVDIQADQGQDIYAPSQGKISFVGKVAGKDVLSVVIDGLTTSFEPATSSLSVGSPVSQGAVIGQVAHNSDHCQGQCLHWGVRKAAKTYLDPLGKIHPHRIVLKAAN